jgi:hypothetical protein
VGGVVVRYKVRDFSFLAHHHVPFTLTSCFILGMASQESTLQTTRSSGCRGGPAGAGDEAEHGLCVVLYV